MDADEGQPGTGSHSRGFLERRLRCIGLEGEYRGGMADYLRLLPEREAREDGHLRKGPDRVTERIPIGESVFFCNPGLGAAALVALYDAITETSGSQLSLQEAEEILSKQDSFIEKVNARRLRISLSKDGRVLDCSEYDLLYGQGAARQALVAAGLEGLQQRPWAPAAAPSCDERPPGRPAC